MNHEPYETDPHVLGGERGGVFHYLRGPLEWSEVARSLVLVIPSVPALALYWLRIQSLVANPSVEPYIDRPALEWLARGVSVAVVTLLILAIVGAVLLRRAPHHRGFVSVAIHLWFVGIGVGAYAVGPFSTPVLLVYLAGAMSVHVLFDLRLATSSSSMGLLTIVLGAVLERIGLVPYGPVFAPIVFRGARPPDTWVYPNLIFTVALILYVQVGMAFTMGLARRRQAQRDALLREDPLTGLGNRRALEEAMVLETARARRGDAPLAFVMLDLDHFKRVNDTHGHAIGDAVLAEVGKVLRSACREVDTVARFGGEELVMLLPDTDIDGAVVVAERVRTTIESLRVPLGSGKYVSVTLSAGCAAAFGDELRESDTLFRAADTALYHAKAGGRNRVEAFRPSAPLAVDRDDESTPSTPPDAAATPERAAP